MLQRMQEHLDAKNISKMDVNALLMAIKWYKDQQLTNDNEGDVDEYLDAFVALGGEPDKEGCVSKDVLIEIIKVEFELTIDMVVSRGNARAFLTYFQASFAYFNNRRSHL